MTERDDDAASIREDTFLARLVPQVADHLAEQHTGDFDAESSRVRFRAWVTEHTERPAGRGGISGHEGPADPEDEEEQAKHEDSPDSIVPLPVLGRAREIASAEDLGTGQHPGVLQPTAGGQEEIKIGLWGAPGSGKTTYLAALRQALDIDPANGRWVIYPRNEFSAEFMVQHTHNLVANHRFPERTEIDEETALRWHLIGDLAGSRFDRRKLRRRAPMPSKFVLSLSDVSGEAYGYSENQPRSAARRALDHLADAQGLLYFFDPLTEREYGHSMEYLNQAITDLSRRMLAEDRLVNGYLPHYVAVCITKFDNPLVFQQAQRRGLVTPGPDGMPQVLGKDAETLFDMICDGRFWEYDEEAPASASFIRYELKTRFHPDRIRYFVISSIGFFQHPERDPAAGRQAVPRFNPEDYANVQYMEDTVRIRGQIAPINVLEPLLSLQQGISGVVRTRLLRAVHSDYAEERRRA